MFWKKVFEKTSFLRRFVFKTPKKCVGSMVPFPNIPCRPSEWASNFENTLADPLNGRLISKTSLTDPPNGRLISKTSLADPLNGHLFRKTPLQTARRQVFHEKRRKPFRPFGSASSPHGMQQKAGCRETRSTAACLYINGPSAFNPTISHSRSPADGADWRSWDTCAHSS